MAATSLADLEIRDLHLPEDGAHHIVDLRPGVMSIPTSHAVVADTGLMVEADHPLAPHLDHQPLDEDETRARLDHYHPHALDHHQAGGEMLETLAARDRSHPVNHAHYLLVAQKHHAHVHLEDADDDLHQKVEAEHHLVSPIEEDGPIHQYHHAQGRATGEETTAGGVRIGEDIRHTLLMIEGPDKLTSLGAGQLMMIAA